MKKKGSKSKGRGDRPKVRMDKRFSFKALQKKLDANKKKMGIGV